MWSQTAWISSGVACAFITTNMRGLSNLSLEHFRGLRAPCFRAIRALSLQRSARTVRFSSFIAFFIAPLDAEPRKVAQLNDPGDGVSGDDKLVIENRSWIHFFTSFRTWCAIRYSLPGLPGPRRPRFAGAC